MQGPRLQAFETHQTDALVALWRASFEHGVGVHDPHTLQEQRDYFLAEVLPQHAVQVLVENEQLLGFVAASADSVNQLYVHAGHLRRGLGRQLLDWAKAQSGGSLWLYTFARNSAARAFYESQGFEALAFGHEPSWQLDDVRYSWSRPGSG